MKYAGEFEHKQFGSIKYEVKHHSDGWFEVTVPGHPLRGYSNKLDLAMGEIASALSYFQHEGIPLPKPVILPKKLTFWQWLECWRAG